MFARRKGQLDPNARMPREFELCLPKPNPRLEKKQAFAAVASSKPIQIAPLQPR
jgi:hypothetical protein